MKMKRYRRKKKGQMTLGNLPSAVIIFAVAVITLSVMATVINKVQDSQCTRFNDTTPTKCDVTTQAYNISGSGLTGAKTFSDFFDPIAVIVAAVVIIGLILGAFAFVSGRRQASSGV